MKHISKLAKAALILGFALTATNAAAQSRDFAQSGLESGTEARLSFTLNFGSEVTKTKYKPRLELGVRQYQKTSLDHAWIYRDVPYQESKLSLILDKDPQFLLNGQALNFEDDQANIGTAGKIGLGVAGVLVADAIVFVIACDVCRNAEI